MDASPWWVRGWKAGGAPEGAAPKPVAYFLPLRELVGDEVTPLVAAAVRSSATTAGVTVGVSTGESGEGTARGMGGAGISVKVRDRPLGAIIQPFAMASSTI